MNTDLAGKYRPKVLDDLIGQEIVVQTLSNAINRNILHHAFLFVGQIGSGKTSAARILAAVENCEVSPGLHPCGKCSACKEIFDGSHTDITEIDGASGAGKVDQVRELKRDALYHATIAKKKYFIIDECLPYESMVTMLDGSQIPIGELYDLSQIMESMKKANEHIRKRERETNSGENEAVEQFLCGVERLLEVWGAVRSRDMSTGKIVKQKILRYIKIHNDKQMYEIEIGDESGREHTARITGNHKVYIAAAADMRVHYLKAQDLELGLRVYLETEVANKIISIKKIVCEDEFVYNLEVESQDEINKNYFADGLLVSNCHAMSSASNDALLKLLEEPPDHCRFILCTTDVQKMRPAVLSRCQRHDFLKIYWSKIADRLEVVAKQENLVYEKAALNFCAKMASGSMRSGLQHLEKLASFGDDGCTLSNAQSMFGSAGEMKYFDLVDQILGDDSGKADATAGFKIINEILSTGIDFSMVYGEIADHLRNLMVGLSASNAYEFIHLSEEGKKRLREQLKKVTRRGGLEAIVESITKLNQTPIAVSHKLSAETALQTWFLQSVFIFRQ